MLVRERERYCCSIAWQFSWGKIKVPFMTTALILEIKKVPKRYINPININDQVDSIHFHEEANHFSHIYPRAHQMFFWKDKFWHALAMHKMSVIQRSWHVFPSLLFNIIICWRCQSILDESNMIRKLYQIKSMQWQLSYGINDYQGARSTHH